MSRKKRKSQPRKTAGVQVIAVVGVLALIAGVLILKARKSDANSAVGVTLPTAESAAVAQSSSMPLPEAQLDQLLAESKPVFAFFHSTTCVQCVRMTEIVEQVYPDFSDEVALVDVNVYDERNSNLLQRAGLRYIPTLIFIDRTGQGESHVGVMDAETLRERLQALAGE